MSVCCKCCVLSGRGLCDELIPRPEESYRLWCVSNVVIVKPRRNEEAQAHIGLSSHTKKKKKKKKKEMSTEPNISGAFPCYCRYILNL
jgi:hypothetical protein